MYTLMGGAMEGSTCDVDAFLYLWEHAENNQAWNQSPYNSF